MNACFTGGVIRKPESLPYPHKLLLGSVIYMMRGDKEAESFDLRFLFGGVCVLIGLKDERYSPC